MIVINLLEKDFIETSIYEYITKYTKKHNIERFIKNDIIVKIIESCFEEINNKKKNYPKNIIFNFIATYIFPKLWLFSSLDIIEDSTNPYVIVKQNYEVNDDYFSD